MDRFNFFQKAVLAYISNPRIAEQARSENCSIGYYSIKQARDLIKLMEAEAVKFEDDDHDYYYSTNNILERIADNIEYLLLKIEEIDTEQKKKNQKEKPCGMCDL